MRPEARDAGLLWDMLEFARDSLEYARTITYDDLLADKYARYTLAKTLELIGEAASRVSPQFRQAHPEIDWIPVIGFPASPGTRLSEHQLQDRVGRRKLRSPRPDRDVDSAGALSATIRR